MTRKNYIDNLRWIAILILIPYHAAMAWNTWGERNYIVFGSSRAISSLIVFISPYYMPLLFLLAGISTKYALAKRTGSLYIRERAGRLLVPFVFGTVVFMPVMAYLADRYNCGYEGSLLAHYSVFLTKFTDLTGGDGGFSFGQFWFLLYLFVISLVALGVIAIGKKIQAAKGEKNGASGEKGNGERSDGKSTGERSGGIPFWGVLLLGLPIPLLHDILSVGGKSIAEFLYVFLLGYYVFSQDQVVGKLERTAWLLASVGIVSSILNVYLFIWSSGDHSTLNTVTNYVTEWFMLLALIGLGKKCLDTRNKVTDYMSRRSFPFFSFHFIFVVIAQYLLADPLKEMTALLYFLPVLIAYLCTFLCAEICVRVPVLCFLTGTKRPVRQPSGPKE